MRCLFLVGMAIAALGASSLSAQTVTLTLSSPKDGTTVQPGEVINWSIGFTVSSGDNAGLALLTVDLVQSEANPTKFAIPPADSVPWAMTNFSRPAGFSNPGETIPQTGYVGVQRGSAGVINLRQIGGAQNTLGTALPAGSGVAESASVMPSVGQGGSVTLASGSFTAPIYGGVYSFNLEKAVANVLTAVNPLPQHSPAVAAVVMMADASIEFTVDAPPCDPCDVNCDGQTNGLDIQAFIDVLTTVQSDPCSPCAGDMAGNDGLTLSDVAPLVNCLLGV